MYNSVSPPTLVAMCRDMVRQVEESALHSAPGVDFGLCTSWLQLSCSPFLLFCQPMPACCQTDFLLVLFDLFAFFLILLLLNYWFVLRTWSFGGGGCFHLYFWSPYLYSLGSCYCVCHLLQNLKQSWNTIVNTKVGITGIFIDLGTVYGLLFCWVFFSVWSTLWSHLQYSSQMHL